MSLWSFVFFFAFFLLFFLCSCFRLCLAVLDSNSGFDLFLFRLGSGYRSFKGLIKVNSWRESNELKLSTIKPKYTWSTTLPKPVLFLPEESVILSEIWYSYMI